MKPRCDRCEFWTRRGMESTRDVGVHRDDLEGSCHRYPPQLDVSDLEAFKELAEDSGNVTTYTDYRMWNYPVTCGFDWCGEFRRK